MNYRLLASGRDADVYVLDERRVLRRYRDGGDVAAEVAVMAYVSGHGFPAPVVYEGAGTDLVMARVDGPSLAQALLSGSIPVAAAAAILADLHTLLHALPAPVSQDPAVRVLHLDLHPENVMLGPDGPVLIDWRNATEGPPDLDLALTALIIAEATVGSILPVELIPLAQELLTSFLGAAGGDPLALLGRALAYRAADPNLLPDEQARLTAAATGVRRAAAGR